MFNNLNLTKSLLEAVQKVVTDNKEEFSLPKPLMEAAEAAAKASFNCMTLEDKKNILGEHFSRAVEANNLDFDTNTVVNFERAVNYYAANQQQKQQ